MDDNEIITSFSNPNYTLNSTDELNSNNLPPNALTSQYYSSEDIENVYETINTSDITSKTTVKSTDDKSEGHGHKTNQYKDSDSVSMGLDSDDYRLTHHSNENINRYTYHHPHHGVLSPSDSEGVFSMDSTATTPADSIVAVEHTDEESPYAETRATGGSSTGGTHGGGSSGFLGYYSKLLQQSSRESESETDGENSHMLSGGREDAVGDKMKLGAEEKAQALRGRPILQGFDPAKDVGSPGGESNDSGIQADVPHIRGPINDDIYAVVDKKQSAAKKQAEERRQEEDELPPGWEKYHDENGPYYWHIKSGTLQREAPPPPSPSNIKLQQAHTKTRVAEQEAANSTTTSQASGDVPLTETQEQERAETPSEKLLHQFEGHALNYASESLKTIKSGGKNTEALTTASKNGSSTTGVAGAGLRFAVRSLGWVEIAEEDLTPERSSKAVNKCIVDLSLGKHDINDVVGRWGDGKDLHMDLDEENLTLTDPADMTLLNVQAIHSIRVWGVGRDNGRDFAYVARDRVSRKHMCHVFRCDTPARQIANTLRDICKKIMMERSLQHGMQAMSTSQKSSTSSNASRPNNLPNLEKPGQVNNQKITFQDLIKNTSFPTPMEEPKKVLRCHYLGETIVGKATGVDTLNSAMEKVYARVPPETWNFASVAVAPSTITVTEHNNPDNVLAECRVRFLSFMGIALRNVRLCSFIMHTAQDQYVAHVFHCEPSAGALCKTIEAACKLRYQKCLDAHHKQMQNAKQQSASQQQSKSPTDPSTAINSHANGAAISSKFYSLKAGVTNMLDILKKKSVNNS